MIRLRTIIEIAGFPKEHIEQTMQKIITNLKQDEDLVVLSASVAETKQIKNIWSTFTELELEFRSITNMLNFYFDYTPSYIEILQPEHMEVKSVDFSNFINDLLARLHQYNAIVANLNAENIVMKKKLSKPQLNSEDTEKQKQYNKIAKSKK